MKRPDLKQYGTIRQAPSEEKGGVEGLLWLLPIFAFLLLAFQIWGGPDDQTAEQSQYCSMWEIWHADRRAGVPIEKRYGWPDQAGHYYEDCVK